ncbi:unnamed protein product [Orchesella dallaii]|uniref:Uncharacterized protein n=1 Tax=Orchesella dallaii TaxID=48710 RepID=A0ABP1QIU0_9HEXA
MYYITQGSFICPNYVKEQTLYSVRNVVRRSTVFLVCVCLWKRVREKSEASAKELVTEQRCGSSETWVGCWQLTKISSSSLSLYFSLSHLIHNSSVVVMMAFPYAHYTVLYLHYA